jgi:Amt family ammonium transporter
MFMDWHFKGKPSAVGISVGAVCGLVAITPASGYVAPMPSIIIGLAAGALCNYVASLRARTRLDDTLDVFAAHGVGGMWGTIATGLFASTAINAAGPNGLFYGNPAQLGIQAVAVVIVASFAFFGSFVILKIINAVMPLRVSAKEEDTGLDISQHGEEAYGA